MRAVVNKLKASRVGDLAIRRNPIFYASVRDQLRAQARASVEERREWTQARLREVLRSAVRSPYGRRLGAGIELERWPLLEKMSVRSDPAAFVCGPSMFAVKGSTGGTTGMPLQLSRSLRSVVVEQVCLDELMSFMGVDPKRAKIAVLRADSIKDPSDMRPPFWLPVAGGQRMMFSSHHLNATTVTQFAEALEAFRPDVLWGYPTALESLCVNLRRARRPLHVARVMTGSELLRPNVWQLTQATLRCDLLDYYGQAERVAFAYAQRPGQYRFFPGYAHVELHPVARDGDQMLHEIVGTNLWNPSMPLPRYRTGDLVALPSSLTAAQVEEVALGVRTFTGVLGRDGEFLISPEGVRVTGINHFPRDVAHVVRIQVIQEAADHVRILVLPDVGYSSRDAEQLTRNARAKLPAAMRISIEPVDRLERTAAGKTPYVIHRPPVQALLHAARDIGVPA